MGAADVARVAKLSATVSGCNSTSSSRLNWVRRRAHLSGQRSSNLLEFYMTRRPARTVLRTTRSTLELLTSIRFKNFWLRGHFEASSWAELFKCGQHGCNYELASSLWDRERRAVLGEFEDRGALCSRGARGSRRGKNFGECALDAPRPAASSSNSRSVCDARFAAAPPQWRTLNL